MIDFYTAATPNGKKVALILEELGIPYQEHAVDLKSNAQKNPEFLAMNPNGKIPVIVDHLENSKEKVTVFESGAILFYLAEKYGKFIGKDLEEKTRTLQWVMFQMSAIGPIFGNYYYGVNSLKPHNPGYIERFEKEAHRLLSVMEMQLSENNYLAGSEYTIADMATFPWIESFAKMNPHWFSNHKAVNAWIEKISKRPACTKIFM